ncbi:NAD(P)/FAD-dependent oxidoreductase [Luteolibacter sp. Populi]|uniref:NAD(P)/FAD-dependent oxidoreductase n=1 Tax=Luteolibacter sp. Populi TaxID=3230487 RepID=UPI0034658812
MDYDAIIIGGGPGGSTAGSTLAKAGKKVLILERERFPRFHVGESLIPYGNDVLREIGAWEKMEKSAFMEKLGAEFVLGNSKASIRILFGRYLKAGYAQTFQVERAKFDNLLLEHSGSLGCEIWQETKVKSATITDDGVTVSCDKDGTTRQVSARWIFDASGRDAFLGKQMQLPKTDLGLPKKFATFAHFKCVERNCFPDQGHITIVRLDFGWFWMIPLDAERTSVGLVQTLEHFKATGMSPGECFNHVVATTTELQRRMGKSERVNEFAFAGDYTYRHLQNAGPRWFLIGDAAGFIDPIFSSGVMLAIRSGNAAAKECIAADAKGTALSPRAQKRYTKHVGKMCQVFLNMIKMFYDNKAFEVFMDKNPPKGMEWAVNNLVAGNTRLGWRLRLHVWAFYAICAIQKRFELVPHLDLSDPAAAEPPAA